MLFKLGKELIYLSTINYFSEQNIVYLINFIEEQGFLNENISLVITDNSRTIDYSFKSKYDGYGNIIFLDPNENLGFGRGHNYAFNSIKPNDDDVFVIMNNDIRIFDFEEIYQLICSTPHNEMRSPTIMNGNEVWFAGARITNVSSELKFFKSGNKVISSDFLTGCFLICTAKTYRTLNGFDDEFFMYAEDLDLSIRAKKLGINLVVYPNTIHHDIGSGKNGDYSDVYLFHNSRNRVIVACKHFGLYATFYAVFKYSVMRVVQLLLKNNLPKILVALKGTFDGVKVCKKL